ncbi:MAG: dynamin family protein [Aliishimia sp.]
MAKTKIEDRVMKMDDIQQAIEDAFDGEAVPVHAEVASAPDFMNQGLDTLQEFRDDMDDLEESLRDIESFGGPEVKKKAQRLIQSMHAFEPSITMIGQIKSGKTSLVNAMVGRPDFLPSDVNPWTSVVTSLHLNSATQKDDSIASFQLFDQGEWDHLVENGGRIGELSSRAGADDELQKLRGQISEMRDKTKARLGKKFELLLGQTHNYSHIDDELIQRYVCMGDDFGDPTELDAQGQFADITKSADLFLDAPALPISMCIRDTPGVNDTFMMREQITIKALRGSRICLVVLSASQALSAMDMALVRLIANVKSREVVIFVNRIDELSDPASQIEEIRSSIVKTMADHKGPTDMQIVFGSAYWANAALQDAIEVMASDSANALQGYAGAFLEDGVELDNHAVWALSGIPDLYDAIAERIASGEGAEMMKALRKRALNHLRGLQASSKVVSMRLDKKELKMLDPAQLDARLTELESRARASMGEQVDRLINGYGSRVDRSRKQFLDRAVESLLAHLERNGENELWQYSPDGLRILLRSSYQTLRRNVAKCSDSVLATASTELTEIYRGLLSIELEGFEILPPQAPEFPPPVTLGQTIALDLQNSWWKGWWQRRKGYAQYADAYYELIEAEIAPIVTDLKIGHAEDIRRIATEHLEVFLAEQRGILGDVVQKSQISERELKGLFGITAQEERDALFEILFEELSPEGDEEIEIEAPARHVRPTRPSIERQGDAA